MVSYVYIMLEIRYIFLESKVTIATVESVGVGQETYRASEVFSTPYSEKIHVGTDTQETTLKLKMK